MPIIGALKATKIGVPYVSAMNKQISSTKH
jgi:hypothetical protein